MAWERTLEGTKGTDVTDNSNTELVRDAYNAFAKGDMETIDRLFDENIVFVIPGRSPIAGEYRSKKSVLELFGQLGERSGGTFTVEVRSVLGDGELVLALIPERGERNGKKLNQDSVDVIRVVDGKLVELRHMTSDQHAEDEFWS
jgi:ketosteroid isomerase-like protein